MAQQTINLGTNPNDGEGDNIRVAFDKCNDNFDEIYTAGPVSSNIKISGQTINSTNTNGNIVLSPDGTGKIVFDSNIIPDANNARTIGGTTSRIKGMYIGSEGLDVTGDANVSGAINSTGPVRVGQYANAVVRDQSLTTPTAGMIILTGTTFQGYNGSAWVDLS
jgi:hypothetical protein